MDFDKCENCKDYICTCPSTIAEAFTTAAIADGSNRFGGHEMEGKRYDSEEHRLQVAADFAYYLRNMDILGYKMLNDKDIAEIEKLTGIDVSQGEIVDMQGRGTEVQFNVVDQEGHYDHDPKNKELGTYMDHVARTHRIVDPKATPLAKT